eukprot:scaffold12200_cov18-Tisochrysis_lutea.AAC.1
MHRVPERGLPECERGHRHPTALADSCCCTAQHQTKQQWAQLAWSLSWPAAPEALVRSMLETIQERREEDRRGSPWWGPPCWSVLVLPL